MPRGGTPRLFSEDPISGTRNDHVAVKQQALVQLYDGSVILIIGRQRRTAGTRGTVTEGEPGLAVHTCANKFVSIVFVDFHPILKGAEIGRASCRERV